MPILKTTFRDVRVTDRTPANVWLARSSIGVAFAAAMRRRFARHMRFLSADLVLRRPRANVTLQRLLRHFQISVTPRFELKSQAEKYYRIVERQTESRMFPQTRTGLTAAPAVEHILHRLAFYTTPRRADSDLKGGKVWATHLPVDITTIQKPQADALSLPVYRRTPISFAPVEMMTHQPRRTSLVSAEPEKNVEPTRPRFDNWPTEERQRSAPAIDAINVKQLTDHVMEALDRRLVAGHERLTRR